MRRALAWVGPCLLAAFASQPAHARTDGWDAVVDLDRETSCRAIAAALEPLVTGKTPTAFIKITGSLAGEADEIGVPVRYRSGGGKPGPAHEAPVQTCLPLIPAKNAGYANGAPVADGSSLNGVVARIHFENVQLTVSCQRAQSRDFVALFLGAGWLAGYESGSREYAGGTISGGVVLSGLLRVRFEGDCDGGRAAGIAPELNPNRFLSARGTSRLVMFVNGLMRSDLTKLTLDASGWPARDHDDLCIVHHHAWGVRVQGIRCGEFGGGGILAYGSADSSYRDVYITASAGAGVYLGDPSHGASISSFQPASGLCIGDDGNAQDGEETCGGFIDHALTSLELSGIVEGNAGGNVLAFGAADRVRLDFRGESAVSCRTADCSGADDQPMHGPNLGLFGGRCHGGARAGMPGFVDSVFAGPPRDDCPGGRLLTPPTRMGGGSLTVTGEIGGDRGFDGAKPREPDWNGIDVGAGFLSGVVRLPASVGASDVGCEAGCDDRSLDLEATALLGADSDARGLVDLTGYRRIDPASAIGPYPFVRHDGERWTQWRAGGRVPAPAAGGRRNAWILHALRGGAAGCSIRVDDGTLGLALHELRAMTETGDGSRILYVGRAPRAVVRPWLTAAGCSAAKAAGGEAQFIPSGD